MYQARLKTKNNQKLKKIGRFEDIFKGYPTSTIMILQLISIMSYMVQKANKNTISSLQIGNREFIFVVVVKNPDDDDDDDDNNNNNNNNKNYKSSEASSVIPRFNRKIKQIQNLTVTMTSMMMMIMMMIVMIMMKMMQN